jgi:hypothetical protein
MTWIFADLFGLLFGVVGYITSGKDAEFCLKFGLMEPDEFGEYEIRTETTHIPMRPSESDPAFRFGYTLEYADDRTFSSYFRLALSAPPKIIGGGLAEAEISNDRRVLTSAPVVYQGRVAEAFALNESDPLGKWQIDIYVNDALLRSIPFTVVSPKSNFQ